MEIAFPCSHTLSASALDRRFDASHVCFCTFFECSYANGFMFCKALHVENSLAIFTGDVVGQDAWVVSTDSKVGEPFS